MSNYSLIKVWDILIRIFHWSLVIAFAVAYITSEEENPVHIYSGYIVLGLIVFRVVWGFVGSKYAKFSDFVRSPKVVYHYVQQNMTGNPQHYLGHNPVGGWMVLAMLIMLFVVTLSGLKVYAIEEGKGLLAANSVNLSPVALAIAEDDGDDDDNKKADASDEEFWEEIHEVSSNLMVFMIVLHILGVIVSSRKHKENLVKAMLTGNKEQK